MKRQQLMQKVEASGKGIFTINELRMLFPEDAYIKTSIKRMLDCGELIQVVRGVYAVHPESLNVNKIATQLYYPSYISFESALAQYGIINQGPIGLTLATSRHSKLLSIAGVECNYSKLKTSLFFGFDLIDTTYTASPEKAVLDELYLISMGKRKTGTSEWYLDDLDREKLKRFAKAYPASIQHRLAEMGLV
jgi:predicted transcriptional regulator of viral defense system